MERSRLADIHPARTWHGLWWFGGFEKLRQFDHKPCQVRADANARVVRELVT